MLYEALGENDRQFRLELSDGSVLVRKKTVGVSFEDMLHAINEMPNQSDLLVCGWTHDPDNSSALHYGGIRRSREESSTPYTWTEFNPLKEIQDAVYSYMKASGNRMCLEDIMSMSEVRDIVEQCLSFSSNITSSLAGDRWYDLKK
jgi:hypothetical protein